jgi:hypothetical protein
MIFTISGSLKLRSPFANSPKPVRPDGLADPPEEDLPDDGIFPKRERRDSRIGNGIEVGKELVDIGGPILIRIEAGVCEERLL